ncbi:hypothetical protein LP52_20275 [Streptomonospora alba]|uniref:Uncharacterized protein n=1 Tax=Streptomonospora alba TaxID=183763 RepID=A0A0C2J7A5_9ACTN|nr:hypothetical protein [Streptomonospora alba]KIH97301.1 hypothetical protein LP52_20275 [Streptomonospora alba]
MAVARTRIYTDDTRLFWQQLGKVAVGGAALFAGCVLWGIRDAVVWASAAAAVISLAVMILVGWRTRAPYGRVRFVLDESVLHYRRVRRGRCAVTRRYRLDDIAGVQLRTHVSVPQSLEFGFDRNGLPELRIETISGEVDSYHILAIDFEGCEEFRSFIADVCDSAGMEKRRPGISGPGDAVDRWDNPAAVRTAPF